MEMSPVLLKDALSRLKRAQGQLGAVIVGDTPAEFAAFVEHLRVLERALGDGRTRIMPGEEKWRAAGRKSLVAARDVQAGERLTLKEIEIKRPALGIEPASLSRVIGCQAKRAIPKNTPIQWEMISRSCEPPPLTLTG